MEDFEIGASGLPVALRVADATLEAVACQLDRDATPAEAARRLIDDDSGFVPICHENKLIGAIYEEDLLRALADEKLPSDIHALISRLLPTCMPRSPLADAVRLMLSCYLRKLPVVGESGELLGLITLSEAAALSVRDPTVADVLERFATSPSLFARRMR